MDRTASSLKSLSFVWVLSWLFFLFPQAWADKTSADYFVSSLPGQPDGPLLKMHAGHVEISPEHNGNLFFWHFENRHIANRPRTVIWLNGGPGCSSEDGVLMEIGPYRVTKAGNLTYNEGSWDEFANLLFVDNPVGTGYSYVNGDSYVHELDEMANQFVAFLEKWFAIFPQYEHDDLYFAGESYAGQHIPYIARAMLDRNANPKTKKDKKWNLKGLLIGNGWISPVEQYRAYGDFAYAEGLIQGGTPAAKALERSQSDCYAELGKPGGQDRVSLYVCEAVLNTILDVSKRSNGQCVNMYDVRLSDSFPACGSNWPPDLPQVTKYLRDQRVVKALHVNLDKREGWSECDGGVMKGFTVRQSKPSITLLPRLLEELPILLFSGAKDMICNHLGTEDFISNMEWRGGKGFETSPGEYAPKRDWIFEGESAGIYQEARNLTYVLFYNSSHMVPFDYPRRSRDMLDRFMGVDIASIGGKPVDSQIDGEKSGPQTSVGGHTNSTAAQQDAKEKLHQAELQAYYRSGEIALLVVVIGAALFGWWVWTSRKKAQLGAGGEYAPVAGGYMNGKSGDLEAQAFDEAELDNLSSGGGRGKSRRSIDEDHYDLGSDSEDEEDIGISDNKTTRAEKEDRR